MGWLQRSRTRSLQRIPQSGPVVSPHQSYLDTNNKYTVHSMQIKNNVLFFDVHQFRSLKTSKYWWMLLNSMNIFRLHRCCNLWSLELSVVWYMYLRWINVQWCHLETQNIKALKTFKNLKKNSLKNVKMLFEVNTHGGP